jgi:hypothetical protein
MSASLRLSPIEQDLCIQIYDRYISIRAPSSPSLLSNKDALFNVTTCSIVVAVKMCDMAKASHICQVSIIPYGLRLENQNVFYTLGIIRFDHN